MMHQKALLTSSFWENDMKEYYFTEPPQDRNNQLHSEFLLVSELTPTSVVANIDRRTVLYTADEKEVRVQSGKNYKVVYGTYKNSVGKLISFYGKEIAPRWGTTKIRLEFSDGKTLLLDYYGIEKTRDAITEKVKYVQPKKDTTVKNHYHQELRVGDFVISSVSNTQYVAVIKKIEKVGDTLKRIRITVMTSDGKTRCTSKVNVHYKLDDQEKAKKLFAVAMLK